MNKVYLKIGSIINVSVVFFDFNEKLNGISLTNAVFLKNIRFIQSAFALITTSIIGNFKLWNLTL